MNDTPNRELQIAAWMSKVDLMCNRIETLTNDLLSRLSYVMITDDCDPDQKWLDGVRNDKLCPLANDLRLNHMTLNRVSENISSILDRLEIGAAIGVENCESQKRYDAISAALEVQ